jgi:hypothetical protein
VLERLADLRVRLMRVRVPSLSVPLIAAAGMQPRALAALESGVLGTIRGMLGEIALTARRVERSPDRDTALAGNRALTLLQLRADALFRTIDLYHDAFATRADAEVGLLLAGTDRLLASALRRPVPGYSPPAAVSYLDSGGRGGAITRARTRLPGGIVLPVALVRVSPESLPTRLSSALHEVGHQLAVDLNLLDEARELIMQASFDVLRNRESAALWASWTSELLPDAFAAGLGAGAPAVDGLQRVLSLPPAFLYVVSAGDPHPPGAVRVPFALAFSRLVHPDPLLELLWQRFTALYAAPRVPEAARTQIAKLNAAACRIAQALTRHRFRGLGGETLVRACEPHNLRPDMVRRALEERHALLPARLVTRPPLFALAMIGFARLLGRLDATGHDRVSRGWLGHLARMDFRNTDQRPTHFQHERMAA